MLMEYANTAVLGKYGTSESTESTRHSKQPTEPPFREAMNRKFCQSEKKKKGHVRTANEKEEEL